MICPYCAEEIKDEAKVCKHCGRNLEPPKLVLKQVEVVNKGKTLVLIGSIGMIVSLFLPWATIQSRLLNLRETLIGIEGDGIFVLILAAIILVDALVRKPKLEKNFSILSGILSVIAFFIPAFRFMTVFSSTNESVTTSIGVGLLACIVFSLVSMVGGFQRSTIKPPLVTAA